MSLLFENDDLRITREDGDSDVAVISFAGISFGFLDRGEFRNSLTTSSSDVYYVFDKGRRWFNGSHERLALDLLNQQIDQRSSKAVFTLGNSMGGTGAISFARDLLNCQRAIGFCPQSSVHPEIAPFEIRWRDLRGSITEWTLADPVVRLAPTRTYYLFYGADDPLDMKHAARFANARPETVSFFLMPGCGHDVAFHLKKRGILSLIIGMLTRPAEVARARIEALIPDAAMGSARFLENVDVLNPENAA